MCKEHNCFHVTSFDNPYVERVEFVCGVIALVLESRARAWTVRFFPRDSLIGLDPGKFMHGDNDGCTTDIGCLLFMRSPQVS